MKGFEAEKLLRQKESRDNRRAKVSSKGILVVL